MTLDELRKFKMVYLATPYTKHPEGLDYAYKIAAGQVGYFGGWGVNVYSPITHWHQATIFDPQGVLRHSTPQEWFDRNLPMMLLSDCMVIPNFKEVGDSEGIAKEADEFMTQNKPVIDWDGVRMRGYVRPRF